MWKNPRSAFVFSNIPYCFLRTNHLLLPHIRRGTPPGATVIAYHINSMTKKFFIGTACTAAALLAPLTSAAAEFNRHFQDSTLRVDYILAGKFGESNAYFRKMSKSKGWAGRRANLDRTHYRGNGMLTLVDAQSKDTIYRHTFSTLFQEWQTTAESHKLQKAFEGTYNTPLPKKPTELILELFDNRGNVVATSKHLYTPDDILVERRDAAKTPRYTYVHKGGDPKNTIDVAILAEGYSAKDMPKFMKAAKATVDAIFDHEPFKSRKQDFNFIAVPAVSKESGVCIPRDNKWVNNSFGSNFDTFYSARYLTSSNVFDIYDALEGVPYEHIIILANSDTYGGGGIYNSYTLTTTGHANFKPVVVHEFGHSYGGLADEYFYEVDVMSDTYALDKEPWEPNITTLVDFDSKWKNLMDKNTPIPTPVEDNAKYKVGVYEGGGYAFKGVYRPVDKCRMRVNDVPAFCPACQQALDRLTDFYLGKPSKK